MSRDCVKCGKPANRIFEKKRAMCDLHFRVEYMVKGSILRGKTPPERKSLEEMILGLDQMKCPACGIVMRLHSEYNGRSCVASVQHWEDGRISVLCVSCNSRHRDIGDEKFHLLTNENKKCSYCKEILPLTDFYKGDRFGGRSRECKECVNAQCRERYRSKRDTRKQKGTVVADGDNRSI